jgi:hypothetical protein
MHVDISNPYNPENVTIKAFQLFLCKNANNNARNR